MSCNALKGILSEIDSICSSVGKKEGKKLAQFVSLAANKIWSSVGGKWNKKDEVWSSVRDGCICQNVSKAVRKFSENSSILANTVDEGVLVSQQDVELGTAASKPICCLLS